MINSRFQACFPQQVQHGVRRAIGVVFRGPGIGAGELIVRMETGNLKDTFQLQIAQQGIRGIKKFVVGEKILQHTRMDQQRGFDVRLVFQALQL